MILSAETLQRLQLDAFASLSHDASKDMKGAIHKRCPHIREDRG